MADMDLVYSDLIDYLCADSDVKDVVQSNFSDIDLNNLFSAYWGDDDNGLPELLAVVSVLEDKIYDIKSNNKFVQSFLRHIRNEFLLVESDWDELAKHVVWGIMKGE